MKNIREKTARFMVLMMMVFTTTSCEDYFDINEDPDNPTNANSFQLLPGTQAWIGFGTMDALNRITETWTQRITNSRYEFYAPNGGEINNDWDRAYRTLLNLEDIIELSATREAWHYTGVAKLQKAYLFSILVDLFDDIPFSEASKGAENFAAEFDDSEQIYDQLIALIDEGIADLNETSTTILGGNDDDLVYGGDVENWIKMGNTLKLKLYNQIRLVEPQVAAQGIDALLNNPDKLIQSNAENFNIPFYPNASPNNLNPYYQTFYVTKGENHISTFLDSVLNANEDPRYPYLIYNQSGNFAGRKPGDGITIRGNDANTKSIYAVYPTGGLYDDGGSVNVDAQSGDGDAPARLITYYMRKFIEAEAKLTLEGVDGNAAEALEEAIRASFDDILSFSRAKGAPNLTDDEIDLYVDARMAAFEAAATEEEKLEIIMLEKYVALTGNGIETYNDYRRTGYPVLANPITPEGPFPLRFPYATSEIESNPNAPEEQPADTAPVFWDING